MASAESSPQVTTHDKSVLWYTPELQNIETPAREIFENYCKIPSDQVTSHILQVVRSSFSMLYGRFLGTPANQIPFWIERTGLGRLAVPLHR